MSSPAYNAGIGTVREVADANARMASDEVDVFKLNNATRRSHRRVALLRGLLDLSLVAEEQIDGVGIRIIEQFAQSIGENTAGHDLIAVLHGPAQVCSSPFHHRVAGQRSIERHRLFPTVNPGHPVDLRVNRRNERTGFHAAF